MQDHLTEKTSNKCKALRIRTYIDPAPILDKKQIQVQRAIYICHDKDLNDDGTPKQKHWHVNIYLVNSRKPEEIRRWFVDDENPNAFCQYDSGSFSSAYEYYLHHTEGSENKYQYDCSDVHGFKCDPNDLEAVDDEDASYSIVVDMVNRRPLLDILRQYGKNLARYYLAYRTLARDIARGSVVDDDGAILKAEWQE